MKNEEFEIKKYFAYKKNTPINKKILILLI